MVALIRLLIAGLAALIVFTGGIIYCLIFSPCHPKHTFTFGRLFSKASSIFGIKLTLRMPQDAYSGTQYIYIANHQNNWDMCTVCSAVTPNVVTVGKRSIVFMPLFGQIYYLSGNILINRNNKIKAKGTIEQIVQRIKSSNISVWMFPEGTRSRGRGLLPFKLGAFHAAIDANVKIVPIVCSSTDDITLNKINNGHVIVEMLEPISTENYSKENIRDLANLCHDVMKKKLTELNAEVATLNKN